MGEGGSAEADATQTEEHCEMSKSSVMSDAAEYLKSFCGLSK